MDPISNVDQLVLLLRQRLEARAPGAGTARSAKSSASKTPAHDPTGADTIAALAAVDTLDDRQFHKALIQNILQEKFGRRLVNEAQFQQMVDQVTALIEADEGALQMLTRVGKDLRAASRR